MQWRTVLLIVACAAAAAVAAIVVPSPRQSAPAPAGARPDPRGNDMKRPNRPVPPAIAGAHVHAAPEPGDDPAAAEGEDFAPPDGVGFAADEHRLVELARTSDDPAVRQEAALELRYRGSHDAEATLVALLGDGDPEVRMAAVEALEDMRARAATAAVEAAMADEDDDDVRAAMRAAIETLRED